MQDASRIPLWGILIILVCYAATDAYPVLAPLMAAVVLATVLAPVVDRLERWQLPRALSSALICAFGVAVLAGALAVLADALTDWIDRLPRLLGEIEQRMRTHREQTGPLEVSAHKVEEIAKLATGEEKVSKPIAVEMPTPNVVQRLLGLAPQVAGMFSIFVFSLFFLLSEGDRVLSRAVQLFTARDRPRESGEALLTLRQSLSRYFASITLINLMLGTVTALVLSAVGFPIPIIAGICAFLLNFMPYIGAVITATGIATVSLAVGNGLLDALLPASLFFMLTILEGQLVTPLILGSRLSLSPLAVFFSVVLLAWAWGPIGAVLAVPFLTGAAIVLRHWPTLLQPATPPSGKARREPAR